MFNWCQVWSNLNLKFIDSYKKKVLMYRFLYETLAIKERLKMLNIKSDDLSDECGEIENHLHVMYFCSFIKPVWSWFKDLLEKIVDVKCDQPIKT